MKYAFAALSALVALASAQAPKFLNSKFDVTEGEPFTLQYSGCESGCTIVIQKGVSTNLKAVQTLTSSTSGGAFTFTPNGLPSDTYNFKITDNTSNESNYSLQFSYQGTGSTSGSSAPVSTTASATTSVASTNTASSTAATTTTSAKSSLTTVTSTGTSTSSGSSTTDSATTTTTSQSSSTTTTQAPTTATTKVPGSGAGRLSSPMALVAGAVAAMAYLS